MKKVLLLVTMIATVFLCACSEQKPEEIGATTVYVKNDGSVIATFVEDFSQSYYDTEELKADTEADVLITVRCGENAAEVMKAADIQIYKSVCDLAEDDIASFEAGKLELLTSFHGGYIGIL